MITSKEAGALRGSLRVPCSRIYGHGGRNVAWEGKEEERKCVCGGGGGGERREEDKEMVKMD